MQLERVHVTGRAGQEGAKENTHGIVIDSGNMVQLHDVSSCNNTGSGIYVRSSKRISINKAELCNNGGYGYQDSASAQTILANATVTGNKAGQIKNATALSVIENVILEQGGQPQSFTGAGNR